MDNDHDLGAAMGLAQAEQKSQKLGDAISVVRQRLDDAERKIYEMIATLREIQERL